MNLRDCGFQTTRQLCVVWSLLTISALTPKLAYVSSSVPCAVMEAQRQAPKLIVRARGGRKSSMTPYPCAQHACFASSSDEG